MWIRSLFVLVVFCVGTGIYGLTPAQADLKKGVAAYHAGDFAAAHTEFRKLAATGDAHGQFNLGVLYLTGNGVDQNPATAAEWHRKAAEQGLAAAQHGLGVLYYKGLGVEQDYRNALSWFRRAAAQKFAHSEFNIAVMYFNEQGLVRNDLEIIKWLSLAAARDFAAAQYRLGEMYEKAIVFSQDHRAALYWYRLAVENGSGQEAADGIVRMEKSLRLRPSGVSPVGPLTQTDEPDALTVKEARETSPGPLKTAAAASRSESVPDPKTGPSPDARASATENRARYEWRAQFAAFRTENEAEKAWNALTRAVKGALNGLAPIIEKADLGKRGIFYRLQSGPMNNQQGAKNLCARVREAQPKQSCLTVRRPANTS